MELEDGDGVYPPGTRVGRNDGHMEKSNGRTLEIYLGIGDVSTGWLAGFCSLFSFMFSEDS